MKKEKLVAVASVYFDPSSSDAFKRVSAIRDKRRFDERERERERESGCGQVCGCVRERERGTFTVKATELLFYELDFSKLS